MFLFFLYCLVRSKLVRMTNMEWCWLSGSIPDSGVFQSACLEMKVQSDSISRLVLGLKGSHSVMRRSGTNYTQGKDKMLKFKAHILQKARQDTCGILIFENFTNLLKLSFRS